MDLHLVDQSCAQVLLGGLGTTPERHVLAGRCLHRAFERGFDAVGHEVECGATVHLHGFTRVVRQDEHRRVVRRILAPPSPPRIVAPRTANGSEHVAPHDRCADVDVPPGGDVIVDAGLAALHPVHLAEATRRERPAVQAHAALAERVLNALPGSCHIAVERHRHVEREPRHRCLPCVVIRRSLRNAPDGQISASSAGTGFVSRSTSAGGRPRWASATHLAWLRIAQSRSTSPVVIPRNEWRVLGCSSAR